MTVIATTPGFIYARSVARRAPIFGSLFAAIVVMFFIRNIRAG